MKPIKDRKFKCSFCHQIVILNGNVSTDAFRIKDKEKENVYCLNCIDKQFIGNFKMKEIIETERKTNGDKCLNKTKEEKKE